MFRTMRKVTRIGPAVFFGNIVLVVFCFATGVAIVPDVESATGLMGALLLPTCGLLLLAALVSAVVRTVAAGRQVEVRHEVLEGEQAAFVPRGHGLPWWLGSMMPGLLGLWAIGMGVAGLIDGVWIWAVLLAVPAVFFLALPVLALLGRAEPGGVWVTPTRVIDVQPGLRTEVAVQDLAWGFAGESGVMIRLQRPDAVTVTRATRWSGARMQREILNLARREVLLIMSNGSAWEHQLLDTLERLTGGFEVLDGPPRDR